MFSMETKERVICIFSLILPGFWWDMESSNTYTHTLSSSHLKYLNIEILMTKVMMMMIIIIRVLLLQIYRFLYNQCCQIIMSDFPAGEICTFPYIMVQCANNNIMKTANGLEAYTHESENKIKLHQYSTTIWFRTVESRNTEIWNWSKLISSMMF